MSRRNSREWAVQFLFQLDFNPENFTLTLSDFWRERPSSPRAKKFTEELINGVRENSDQIDALIQKYAEHWDIKRMSAVDRNVLRVALYEMYFRPDVPPVVSINEAVDIARSFSSIESGKFVNGILDRARKDLKRDARIATESETEPE